MKLWIGVLALSVAIPSLACKGIAPKNDLRIPVGAKNSNNITQVEFNKVLDRVEEIYNPIIQAQGATFQVKRLWIDETVNAYASREGDNWLIHMHGGMARHQLNTVDGFALVTCHEVGHHLGGAPKAGGDSSATWVTNEGQSDYFGTTKCFRRYAQSDNNVELVKKMNIPEVVTKRCEKVFNLQEDVAICQRGAMAGRDLARVLADISWPKREVSFDSPSRRRVWWTSDLHPKAQCRLDTYFEGALCDKSYTLDFDIDDPKVAACTREEAYDFGPRPRCWYKP